MIIQVLRNWKTEKELKTKQKYTDVNQKIEGSMFAHMKISKEQKELRKGRKKVNRRKQKEK